LVSPSPPFLSCGGKNSKKGGFFMKRMNVLVAVTVVMFALTAVFMARPLAIPAEKAIKEKCFVVGLHLAGGRTGTPPVGAIQQIPVEIVPQYIRVPQGSCVVWVNWIQQAEIQLSFGEGKVCKKATATPMRFTLEHETDCYVTDFKQVGETSSLRFMEKGTYKYEIKMRGRISPVGTGEVTVF
jgi:hypothetical protein